MMTSVNYCRLCTSETESFIDMSGDQGIRLNIEEIIGEHFCLKFCDEFSKYICTTCWWKIENFHVYYLHIKEMQEKLITKYSQLTATSSSNNDSMGTNTDEEQQPNNAEEMENIKSKLVDNNNSIDNNDSDISDNDESMIVSVLSEDNKEPDSTEIDVMPSDKDNQSLTPSKRKTQKTKAPSKTQKTIKKSKTDKDDEQILAWCQMVCMHCTQTFQRFAEVKVHYRDQHQENGYIICCKKKFFRRVRLLQHISHHIDPNVFKCEQCNKTYADKPALMNHMDDHALPELKPFACDICQKSYAKRFKLVQHKKLRHLKEEDKKFICKECGKAFAANSILNQHIRGVHENANFHICEICAKTFKSKLFFQQHCLEHAGIKRPTVQCTLCGVWLKHENSLRSHMQRHAESEKTHTCNFCGKTAPNAGALRSHQRYVHFNEKSFKCGVCEKTFKRALTLKEHMTLHTGEVLYSCSYCQKTFNSNANMHSHKKKAHPEQWEKDRQERKHVNQLD